MKIGDIVPKGLPNYWEIAHWCVANNAHAEMIDGNIVLVSNTSTFNDIDMVTTKDS